jgi:Sulfotransferase domain
MFSEFLLKQNVLYLALHRLLRHHCKLLLSACCFARCDCCVCTQTKTYNSLHVLHALHCSMHTQVRAAVPADRVLVYSVKQGWEPLCAFLKVPVPDTPFPRLNDRAKMQALLRKEHRMVRLLPTAAMLALLAVLAAAAGRTHWVKAL